MPTVKKAANKGNYGNAIVNSKVRSYANDPFFAKKTAEAKETLSKVSLPGSKKK
jgi:hypothetical protein